MAVPAEQLRATYEQAPSLPIDVAVMERSSRVWTLPVEWSWSDVGTWESLAEELGEGSIVTLLPDRGDRYLSTTLFRSVCARCRP